MKYDVDLHIRLLVDALDEEDVPDIVDDYFGECNFGGVEVVETEINDIAPTE